MKHARDDYAPIQDPRGLIPEDEPVFLLRAQDITAPEVVRYWADLAKDAGAKDNIVDAAVLQASRMEVWHGAHKCKVPDMP